MCNIYYIVGSYRHPIGSVDYINALNVFFKKTNPKFKLLVSTKIVENEINIFLESFNYEYIDYMKKVKKNFPNTKYIVICTEFMQFINGRLFFNCFNDDDFKFEKKLVFQDRIFFKVIKKLTLFIHKIFTKKFVSKLKEFINYFLKKIFKNFSNSKKYIINKKNYNSKNSISQQRKEYHNRANCLLEIISFIDLVFCAHPEITKSFKKFFKKVAYDFPYYVEDLNLEITNKKLNGFYIGGNLNEYRKLFLNRMDKYILSIDDEEIYETYLSNSDNQLYRNIRKSNLQKLILEIKLKADLEDLSYELNKNIIKERNITKEDEVVKILKKINPELNPNSVDSLLENYIMHYKSTSLNISHLLYELYIPQSEDWPYSSPMRFWHTFMNNSIPVTFKRYKDHPINMLVEIYRKNMFFNNEDYSLKIFDYNESQKSLFKEIGKQIEELNRNK